MKTPAELSAEEASFRAYIERLPKPAAPQRIADPVAWTPEMEERSQVLAKQIATKLRGES